MIDTFRRVPRLGAAILWAASRDEAMVVEHLVSIGRRSALVRTAHSGTKLRAAPAGRRAWLGTTGYLCPLNQYLLADALGLTAIDVKPGPAAAARSGLVTFREGRVVFHDLPGLRNLRPIPQRLREQRTRDLTIALSRRPGGLDLLIQVSAAWQSVG